jgi:hypothetical protein
MLLNSFEREYNKVLYLLVTFRVSAWLFETLHSRPNARSGRAAQEKSKFLTIGNAETNRFAESYLHSVCALRNVRSSLVSGTIFLHVPRLIFGLIQATKREFRGASCQIGLD